MTGLALTSALCFLVLPPPPVKIEPKKDELDVR
jgi:hypothetical protein